jgi:hypothetical protein
MPFANKPSGVLQRGAEHARSRLSHCAGRPYEGLIFFTGRSMSPRGRPGMQIMVGPASQSTYWAPASTSSFEFASLIVLSARPATATARRPLACGH